MTAGPSGLQLDLLTVIVRLEQIQEQGPEPEHFVWDRVVTCDIPRLRGYLTPETLAWEDEFKERRDRSA